VCVSSDKHERDGEFYKLGCTHSSFHLPDHTQTIRTAIQQGTIILAGFMSEQLEGDLKRGELVAQGRLSKREAEEQAEEWEKVRGRGLVAFF
jgi:hypothetical protein